MNKATKTKIKSLNARVATLRAEMADSYTVSLGRAAVNCVRESLQAAESELRHALNV